MVGHGSSCNRLCEFDDEGLRDGTSHLIDGVHWSGHGSPWQEEVCDSKLPSHAAVGCVEQEAVLRQFSAGAQNALKGDEIEYPCESVDWEEVRCSTPVPLQPQLLTSWALMGDEIEYPCENFAWDQAPERLVGDPGYLHFHFDLSQTKDEDVNSVQFGVAREGMLFVTSVKSKAALATTAFGDDGLKPCDIILEVDGQSGTALELQNRIDAALLSRATVNILVQPRLAQFDVEVQRKGRFWSRLGVEAIVTRQGEVQVNTVHDRGLLPEWNAFHGPSMQILPGDRITHVNGVASDPKDLYEALQTPVMGGYLHIRVATPSRISRKPLVRLPSTCDSQTDSTDSGNSSPTPSRTSSLGNSASEYTSEEA